MNNKNIERRKQFLENQELFKQTKKKFEEARDTHLLYKKRYFNKFISILKIMGEVESRVISNDKQLPTDYGNQYRSSYIFGRQVPTILSIKPADEGVHLKYKLTEDWGDGDYGIKFYKTFIPYNYFDLTDAKLREQHQNWSIMKIKELEKKRKYKIELFKQKMKQEEEIAQKSLYEELKKKFEPNEVTN